MYEVLIQCFQKQMEISTLRIMEYWPAQKPGDLQMDFSNLQKKSISLSVCYIKNIFRPLLSIKNPLCTIIKANSIDSNFTLHDEWVCCSVYSLHWLSFWFNLLVWICKFKWLFVRLIVWKINSHTTNFVDFCHIVHLYQLVNVYRQTLLLICVT